MNWLTYIIFFLLISYQIVICDNSFLNLRRLSAYGNGNNNGHN